jgi:hypothetical protein
LSKDKKYVPQNRINITNSDLPGGIIKDTIVKFFKKLSKFAALPHR